jgi:hypothetical protein
MHHILTRVQLQIDAKAPLSYEYKYVTAEMMEEVHALYELETNGVY